MARTCPACDQTLPLSAFGRNRALPDGLSFYCLACNRRRYREWYRESRLAQGKHVRSPGPVPPGHRWCPTCRSPVAHEDFSRNAATVSGFGSECRACRRQKQNEAYFVRRYGLTRSQVEALRTSQGGHCALCGDTDAAHLDHDHAAGRIRALLCGRCNLGLGLFLDDPGRLHAAIRYLEKHRQSVPVVLDAPLSLPPTPPLGSGRRERRGTDPGRRSTDRRTGGP